jgi:NAD(P)-dependent dehydrogenase (short-subunit alcohol dehydrogenase family)
LSAGRLAGKLALVTGAASGIGRAIAVRFAAEGAAVAIADISGTERAGETLRRVEQAGSTGIVVIGDVSEVEDARRIVDEAAAALGGLDVVVNNAGYFLPPRLVADYDVADFDRILAVNLRGPFLIAKFAIPHLLARGGGAVLGIGSVNGIAVWPGDCAYNASKAGHHMLARTIAIDYATQGIRSNCICPAGIDTEGMKQLADAEGDPAAYLESTRRLHPIGRVGRPEEIAAMAVALCSDEASFVTGALYPVDGGYLAV